MNKLNQFKNLVVTDQNAVKIRTPRTKESKNPTGLNVRIYANGEVYPSEEVISQFDLGYYIKGTTSGAGFDVIDSKTWQPVADQERTILFGWTSKHEPKVDLFSRTRYNDDGTPISNVLEQGTVNTKLLQLVKELGYLTPGMKFVDLTIMTDFQFTTSNGIALIPKEVERGEDKGKPTYERRENEVFYPVIPSNQVEVESEIEVETTN